MVRPSQLSFSTICDFYAACQDARGHSQKAARLRLFRERCLERNNDELYQVYRLLLPQCDNKRGNYALKESKLASVWSNACGFNPKTTARGKSAVAWKASGTEGAGNFSAVMYGYLFRLTAGKQEHDPGEKDLKVQDINNKLDELAEAASAEEKTAVLQWLVQRSSARMLKWITQIILKDLKIGMSDKSVLKDFHPDAEDLYNVTMDLSTVCKELKDRNKRMPRRDVEPGRPVRSQLASAAKSPEEAFRRMKNKTFVVETKFDGDRIQLHRNGNDIQYYSRRGVEHGEYSGFTVMDAVVKKQLKHEKCILDGEMIVWNKTRKVFEPFGGIRSAFTAAKDGKPADSQIEMASSEGLYTSDPDYAPPCVGDIELVFIAFDILFVDEESVINRPLLERLDLLKAAIGPVPDEGIPVGKGTVKGRLAKLVPKEFVLDHTTCSKICHSMEDIQSAFDESIRVQEEGIIIKALDSPWQMNDRSNAWLKIKPDYVHSNDIDAVIIGAFYGTGRHGGLVTQWLLALAEAPPGGSKDTPTNFMSFCKVGNGMSDAELQAVREKLNPYFVPYAQKPKNYKHTNARKTQPDLWVKDISKSIVLQVQADVRTIISKDFATRHSLRFPRVERVRYDKSPFDVQTDQELWDLVNQNKGAIGESLEVGGSIPQPRLDKKKKRAKQVSPEGLRKATVVAHLMPADISSVKQESNILKDCCIHFINYGQHSKQELEALVRRLGGTVYQNWTKDVTHLIADHKDYKFAAHTKQQRDVVCLAWLLDCQQQQTRLPIKPHHYLHLSKKTLQEVPDVCCFGDMYYVDVAPCDVQAVLEHHTHIEDIDITRLPLLASSHEQDSLELPATPQKAEKGQKVHRTALDVIMDVESELARHGYADPSTSLFRGCHLCFLTLPSSQHAVHAAAAVASHARGATEPDGSSKRQHFESTLSAAASALSTQEALLQCQAKRVALQVQLHGGNMTEHVTFETTHLVVDITAAEHMLNPIELLQEVSSKLGGINSLQSLRRSMLDGKLKLVLPSWVEACMQALVLDSVNARRVSEATHSLPLQGSHVTTGEEGQDTYDHRPDGWPWAEAGLPEEPQPSKQKKKGGRRKRSASPVSRDASHATAADSKAAQTDAETKKRPAKRAKRAAGVGAAKVSKRPPRRGKATALGDSSSPSKAAAAVSAQAADLRTDQHLPDEALPGSPIAEDEEVSDWQESPKVPKRRVPPPRGAKKADNPSQGSLNGNLRKAGRSTKGSRKSDRQDAAEFEDIGSGSSEGEEGDGKGQQGSLPVRARGPQGLTRGRNRKRQVIEEDTQDIAMESESGASQQDLSAVASPKPEHSDMYASQTAAAGKQQQAETYEGNVLDRIAGLSSVLNKAHPSVGATTASLGEQDSGQVSEQPENANQGGKSSTVALLDAILNDDDDEEHAPEPSTQVNKPLGQSDTDVEVADDSSMQAAAASEVSHAQEGAAPEQRQQHTEHQPSYEAHGQATAATVSSPRAKGSLRDRVRALGLMKK